MTHCYIFDIDGTLADCSHRLHFIQQKPKNWRSFFADVANDKPLQHVVDLALVLKEHAPIVFVSGRSDECRTATRTWLFNQGFMMPRVYMRRAGDYRDDDIIKGELLDAVLADGFEPIMVFDDRDRVVKMWRARGIPCAQVAEGNF